MGPWTVSQRQCPSRYLLRRWSLVLRPWQRDSGGEGAPETLLATVQGTPPSAPLPSPGLPGGPGSAPVQHGPVSRWVAGHFQGGFPGVCGSAPWAVLRPELR